MLEQILGDIGFNPKEISLYMELLRRGKSTPASLGKATGINRATVYSVAKTLAEKGVITEDLAGKSSYLVAKPPQALKEMVDAARRETKRKEELVEKAIEAMADLPINKNFSVPRVRFIEDERVEEHLYAQSTVWNESLQRTDPDGVWWGFQDHTFVEQYEPWIRWFWENVDENVRLKLLTNESGIEEKMHNTPGPGLERSEVRFWNRPEQFTATIWVVGEYIIMVYTREKPLYLIEIYSAVLAENMRSVFKGLWDETSKK